MPDQPTGGGRPTGPKASGSLLTRKLGPLPVWVYALLILVGAWVYAKYRNKQQAASTSTDTSGTDTSAPEGQAVAPQFVIENNMPATTIGSANQPVPSTPPPQPPTVTPPGKGTKPPTGGGKPPAKPPTKKPGSSGKPPIKYRVVHGDTLTSIAQSHGVTEAELWAFNTDPKNRSASSIATLKRRGQNTIFAGEEILIPQK